MAIRFKKYVDITSGIGAGAQVSGRDFNARIYTVNPLVPTGSVIEFASLDEVGNYFGTTSEEYKRASFYFTFVSKNITRPQAISYARWVDADVAAEIFGSRLLTSLAGFNLITNGVFSLTIGTHTANIGPINFSAAVSLAAVSADIQTAINADVDPEFATATVTYNASRGSFDLVSGVVGAAVISVAAGTGGTDIHNTIGWGSDAIFSDGAVTQTITTALTDSSNISDNFGSFIFTLSAGLNLSELTEAAQWNVTQNVKYIFIVPIYNRADWSTYNAALMNYGGTCATYNAISGEYSEMLPMAVFSATDFSQPNSVQNYMFQQANLTPSVTTDSDSDDLDNLEINYYGQTQQAGQLIDFYQRGVLFGLAVDPSDINVYANEIWLKDTAGVAIMALLLALSNVPANNRGRIQILAALQPVIQQAILNGTISQEKPLTQTQKIYIGELTGDPKAWYQVQGIGYWINCSIVPVGSEFQANYLLVYSKDDSIRFVQGTHVLI